MNDSTRSPIPGRGRKSSGRRRAIIFGIVVLLAGGGWYGWHTYQAKQNAKTDYIYGMVDRGDIEDVVASSGSLQPRDFVDVGAQVSGQIQKIYVEVGDVVKAGDLLVTIDAATAQAKVDANEASIKSARSSIKSRENQLDKNKRDAERQKRLFAEGAATNEAMINAQTQYEDAISSLEQAKLDLEQKEANARIEAANLKYTKIIAPISGTVMSIDTNAKEGSTLNATNSVPKVLRIANLDLMTTKAEVSEADLNRLEKENNPVYFTTLGGGTRKWTSKLKRIEPTANVTNSVVTYNALFDIENEDRFLYPQMTAQIYFIAAEARNVVRVPMAALQQGAQFARELAAKERLEGKKPAAATPGGAPGAAPGAPGARPGAANTVAGAAAAGGSAPATPAAQAPAQGGANGSAPANREANAQGNRANGQGGPGGGFNPQSMQNMTAEQREELMRGMRERGAAGGGTAAGGGFGGGQRAGGANGGFGGGRNMQNMTAEQREEMMRLRGQRGGGAGGAGGGNFNRQGMAGNAGGGTRTTRVARRTQGTVMVRTADGKLESRRVVVGVTDRVLGEVLEGLKEGDEVVIGRREKEAAAVAPSQQRNNNNNNFNPGNFNQGNFNQGGNRGGGRGGF